MGIRNATGKQRRALLRLLTTPHGDQKQQARRGRHPVLFHVSLPLMGIRNATGKQRRALLRLLTTPHGDQKPFPLPCCRGPTAGTHYPSWGSETTSGPLVARARNGPHYPSWGSETRPPCPQITKRQSTHYPSWGSETASECRCKRRPLGLTTPHGDQKPRSVRSHRSPTELTTPHGDQKLVGSVDRMPMACSLPLMGIRNPPYSMPLFTYEWSIRKRNADARPPNCAWPPAQG